MAETREEGMAAQGCGSVGSGSRDVASVEATAPLTPFWVSWWDDPVVSFELHSPWWFSGFRFHGQEDDDEDLSQSSVCAAVMASSEEHARQLVADAYDVAVTLEWRFVEARPSDWGPFSDRFRRADWMRWPTPDGAERVHSPAAESERGAA